MLKREFIQEVSKKTGLNMGNSEKVVNAVFDTIVEVVSSGDSVTLLGFGSFTHTKRVARIGRNPRTGEEVPIPERIVPKFKFGSAFKRYVIQSYGDGETASDNVKVEKMRPPKTSAKKSDGDKPKEKPVAKKATKAKKK